MYLRNEPSESHINGSPKREYAHTNNILTNRIPVGNAKIASVAYNAFYFARYVVFKVSCDLFIRKVVTWLNYPSLNVSSTESQTTCQKYTRIPSATWRRCIRRQMCLCTRHRSPALGLWPCDTRWTYVSFEADGHLAFGVSTNLSTPCTSNVGLTGDLVVTCCVRPLHIALVSCSGVTSTLPYDIYESDDMHAHRVNCRSWLMIWRLGLLPLYFAWSLGIYYVFGADRAHRW